MQRAKLTRIRPDVTLIDDAGASTCYVVTGTRRALVIDTLNGKEDLKEIVLKITNLPLVVVNTHGHCDHIYGNIFFDEAYIHDADKKLMREHFSMPDGQACIKEFWKTPCPTFSIKQGDAIDLGGKKLEVYEVSGHTAGSIVLLDRENRFLYSGDAMNGLLWMQLPESTGIQTLINSLNALVPIRDAFDYILTGHSTGPEDASLIDDLIVGAQELLDGKTENDKEYDGWRLPSKRHDYGSHGHSIVYDEKHI